MDMRKIVLGVLGLSIGLLANLECLLILMGTVATLKNPKN